MMTSEIKNTLLSDYKAWLDELKQQIATARRNASVSLNSALIELYWHIGSRIIEKEKDAAWGSGLFDRLARDLTFEFSGIKGFSRRNLYAVRQWYLFYSVRYSIVPQLVAQIPCGIDAHGKIAHQFSSYLAGSPIEPCA